jgi:hypothetical protein
MFHRLLGAFLAVKTCSKAVLALCLGHGKSPCFSGVAFLRLLGVDARVLKVAFIDGMKILECAL